MALAQSARPLVRRLLITTLSLGAVLTTLSLPARGGVSVAVYTLVALGGLVLWLRSSRTVATAAISTVLTMMWIPAIVERVGQAAGLPENIASWEVVPLWALALSALAGAWIPAGHAGSRAVTVVLCHLAICLAAIPAAVFPATSLVTALLMTLTCIALRCGVTAPLRALLGRVRRPERDRTALTKSHDESDRLWFQTSPSGSGDNRVQVLVGPGGQLAMVHRLPQGSISLTRVKDAQDKGVQAYALNGSHTELGDALAGFATSDLALARRFNVPSSQVSTLATAPHGQLTSAVTALDLAGLWDPMGHRYTDHRVVLLNSCDVGSSLHRLPARTRRGRLGTKSYRAGRAERERLFGDRRQRRLVAAVESLL
ncbi:hypothetical protein [Streptomyces sp. NPDC054865]